MDQISLDDDFGFDSEQLAKNLYLLSGMGVTIYDSHRQWITSYPKYNCAFCQMVRRNAQVNLTCRRNDAQCFDICTKTRRLYSYRCHMGLYEAMLPLYNEDMICGYVMLGQVIDEREEFRRECFALARPYEKSEEKLREAVDAIPRISEEKMTAVTHLLSLYGKYIYENNLVKVQIGNLAESVARYIRNHLNSKILNSDLCNVFYCSRKKLTQEFRKTFGVSITEYANNLRLRKARLMIQNDPDFSIGFIAKSAGFTDQGYFGKLFYKKYGISPTEMQKRCKSEKNENPDAE